MSGWGKFYEIDESARETLQACGPKVQWYDTLGAVWSDDPKQFDAEDSFRYWRNILAAEGPPISRLLEGDFHADFDGCADPDVLFFGRALVAEISTEFSARGREYFERRFLTDAPGFVDNMWMYEPLRQFLKSAADRGSAVILLAERQL